MQSLPKVRRPVLRKAWILVESERWYMGYPCVRVVFDEGNSPPPKIGDCWVAGHLEINVDGKIQERFHKPKLTSLQKRVWTAVVGWAKKYLVKQCESPKTKTPHS
ncbi:MAG: hypothetical protein PWP70_1159 [Moorella sp. (in: firmicutes)]|nr:hypothetical protein [Moorella sp. (in: firmicutes)]